MVSSRSSSTNIVASPVVSVNRRRVEVPEADEQSVLEAASPRDKASITTQKKDENIREAVEIKGTEQVKERKTSGSKITSPPDKIG